MINKPTSPETPKKKLPPELQKLHDDGFAKLQAKLKAGEPVYESDYEFVAKLEAYLKPLVAIEKLKEEARKKEGQAALEHIMKRKENVSPLDWSRMCDWARSKGATI